MTGCCSHGDAPSLGVCSALFSPAGRHLRAHCRGKPARGDPVIERVRAAVTRLAGSPALGRPGRVPGTRELVIPHTPYIVPYRVKGDVVQIITILHSAQRWLERLP
jgi:plasmid stabilization system protein ParE